MLPLCHRGHPSIQYNVKKNFWSAHQQSIIYWESEYDKYLIDKCKTHIDTCTYNINLKKNNIPRKHSWRPNLRQYPHIVFSPKILLFILTIVMGQHDPKFESHRNESVETSKIFFIKNVIKIFITSSFVQ